MASQERWQVSGSAAQYYEQAVASFFAPWAADLVQRARLKPGLRVLDVACGTGIVTRAAAPVLGESGVLVGSDLNEDMLEEARRHRAEGAEVQWHQADMTALPFETDSFDAVPCQHGLQFVPDKSAAAAELRRVLRPGGIAAVSVWCAPELNPYISALAAGLSQHLSDEAGQTMLSPCGFSNPGNLADLFREAGFTEVNVEKVVRVRDPIDPLEAIEGNLLSLPMAEQIHAMEPAARTAMFDDIIGMLDEYISDGMLIHTMSANIALAT